MVYLLLVLTFSSAEERDKFEFIYNRYKNLMMHKAYGILHDYMLAEDAASEAFLRIYKNLDCIDDPTSPRTAAFVVTVVKNVALTMLQKFSNTITVEFDERQRDSFNLEDDVLSRVMSEDVFRLIDELSEELRGVLILKYAHDLPHREIGRLLGISENNVTVRLHRAKKKLAELLQRGGHVNA